ncbi:dephospho-CoA kinase [Salinithrix halophila]|uniref:Dephospho-CoA kinase n=1 Tax=Salinithrix halophila TaxID=1485204 RepID=A0ABV8JB78_9BACL
MDIGLTGGIATGKSTVSRMLRERGGGIVDADQIAREVVEPGTEGNARIWTRFGPGVFGPGRHLDRRALREVVFRDERARKDLNRILHPLIIRRMKEEASRIGETCGRIAVLDTPLLIEEGLTDLVEQVVVVYAPEAIQIQRLMERDGIDASQALRMIRAQMPIEEKKRFADVLIDNSGTLADTERQVDMLWETWVSKNGSGQS